jgi:hypothetical protein
VIRRDKASTQCEYVLRTLDFSAMLPGQGWDKVSSFTSANHGRAGSSD